MIIWLASYPRSGNTLTRTLLNHAFGLASWSEHGDPKLGGHAAVSEVIGHRHWAGDWPSAYQSMRASPHLHVVKTHAPPKDDGPAIYVVRDGRSAIVSYHHYLARLHDLHMTFDQISAGAASFGDWSSHLAAWSPLDRPATLLLRYEDLANDPAAAIHRLAHFLSRSPMGQWTNPFEQKRSLMPEFFHRASDSANIAEWSGPELDRFWVRHGTWMKALGYAA